MEIRPFRPEQLKAVLSLFYTTVHTSNAKDYTETQLDAWAPKQPDAKAWLNRLTVSAALVAMEGDTLLGFGNLEGIYAIDCLYVRAGAQGNGVGGALLRALEDIAWQRGSNSLSVEVSITARPFFLCHGYQEIRSQQVERRGITMKNYVMVRQLEE